jgi:hypothetical protein
MNTRADMTDSELARLKRPTRQMGLRLFADQFTSLRRIAVFKYHNRCSVSDLIRTAVDQFIEEETEKDK